MFCEQCGKKLPDGARFCPSCGTPCPEDDANIETQNGGTEEHVENVEEPIVENERTSDIENDNSDNFEVPKEPKNYTKLTKKAKMIISAVIAVVIIGAVGITAGINTKEQSQTKKEVAKNEKAVKEDKKAETKKEPKAEEEKVSKPEEKTEPEGLTKVKEITNMDSITVNELSDRIEPFFKNLVEDAQMVDGHLRKGEWTMQALEENYSLSSLNVVSDYDEGNFDLYPLYKEIMEGITRTATHYRVSATVLENNFYDEYKYNTEDAEELTIIASVNVHYTNEHDESATKDSKFDVLVTLRYNSGSWDICGVREPDEVYYNHQSSKYKSHWVVQPNGFEYTSLINNTYPTNVAEVAKNASEDNLESVIEMWKQWYYYVAAKNYESGIEENFQFPKVSLFYLTPKDKIPSLAVWYNRLNEGAQYLEVYTCEPHSDEMKIIEVGRGLWNDQSTALKYAGNGTFMISRKFYDEVSYGNVEEYCIFSRDIGYKLEHQDCYIYKSFDAPYVDASENLGHNKKTYFDIEKDAEDIDRIYNECASYQGTVPPVYDTVQEAFENL